MRRAVRNISFLLTVLLCCSCVHKDLCYHHPHDAKVRVNVDWSEFTEESPSGMSLLVYTKDGELAVNRLSSTLSHSIVDLPVGLYDAFVFNQSPDEYESVLFRGIDNYENAEVYTNIETKSWYHTKSDDEKVAKEPDWIGTDNIGGMEVTPEMLEATERELLQNRRALGDDFVIGTLTPENIIYTVTVKVHIKGIYNMRSARASLDGLAEGYMLGQGRVSDNEVIQLLDEWSLEIDPSDPTRGTITTKIKCFGLPGDHRGTPEENELVLTLLLVDNETKIDFPFLVGDKFEYDLEAEVELSLSLELEIPETLPDVPPAGGSSSGFDATVDDWGDEENYEIEL